LTGSEAVPMVTALQSIYLAQLSAIGMTSLGLYWQYDFASAEKWDEDNLIKVRVKYKAKGYQHIYMCLIVQQEDASIL
jgi:hypothetical protein